MLLADSIESHIYEKVAQVGQRVTVIIDYQNARSNVWHGDIGSSIQHSISGIALGEADECRLAVKRPATF